MEVKQALLLGALFVSFCSSHKPAAASPITAPIPPRTAINHDTKQCAEIGVCGDECSRCVLPEGWEFLGYSNEVECPPDYAIVEIHPGWQFQPSEFCCTPGHSGISGDCSEYYARSAIPVYVVLGLVVIMLTSIILLWVIRRRRHRP